jgi:hypothetical protein
MSRVVRNVPHKRRYLALAILALAVAAATALTLGSVSTPFASATDPDTCGYNGGLDPTKTPTPSRASQKFNEIGIIEGMTVTSGGTPSAPITVNVFYSDEHALTLGQSSSGYGTTGGADLTAWAATYSKNPSTVRNTDDAGTNPAGVKQLGYKVASGADGKDAAITPTSVLTGVSTASDAGGRPVAPSLFLTDRTGVGHETDTSGDWQNQNGGAGGNDGNGTAQKPSYVGGTWKNNGAANPLGSDGKVAENGSTNLGPHSETFARNISTAQGLEKYAAELRWDVSTLDTDPSTPAIDPPKAGHTYRVQMMFHDGDHVADTGEACQDITIPKAPSETKTTPKVKVTEDVNINIKTTASAQAAIKAGDTVDVKLFKDSSTNAAGCTDSNFNGGAGATQLGDTKTLTIQAGDIDSNGNVALGDLTYPDNFTGTRPDLTSGKYWWFVQYNGNNEVESSNDKCTEQFSISLPS